MTNEEAKELIEWLPAYQLYKMYGKSDTGEALKIAVEAIEKQIPKPYKVGIDRTWGTNARVKVCPVCDMYLDSIHFTDADGKKRKHVAYCDCCGQAVDYDEEATEDG